MRGTRDAEAPVALSSIDSRRPGFCDLTWDPAYVPRRSGDRPDPGCSRTTIVGCGLLMGHHDEEAAVVLLALALALPGRALAADPPLLVTSLRKEC
jgi:hypothetical protein